MHRLSQHEQNKIRRQSTSSFLLVNGGHVRTNQPSWQSRGIGTGEPPERIKKVEGGRLLFFEGLKANIEVPRYLCLLRSFHYRQLVVDSKSHNTRKARPGTYPNPSYPTYPGTPGK